MTATLVDSDNTSLFKVGDAYGGKLRVRDTFNPKKPRSGTIVDTPENWAVIHWDGVKHSPNGQQWSYEYLEIESEKLFTDENGDQDIRPSTGGCVSYLGATL